MFVFSILSAIILFCSIVWLGIISADFITDIEGFDDKDLRSLVVKYFIAGATASLSGIGVIYSIIWFAVGNGNV